MVLLQENFLSGSSSAAGWWLCSGGPVDEDVGPRPGLDGWARCRDGWQWKVREKHWVPTPLQISLWRAAAYLEIVEIYMAVCLSVSILFLSLALSLSWQIAHKDLQCKLCLARVSCVDLDFVEADVLYPSSRPLPVMRVARQQMTIFH